MHNFVHEMLHNSPAAQRIMDLWNVCSSKPQSRSRYAKINFQEYEEGESKEAQFVKGGSVLPLHQLCDIESPSQSRP